MVDSSVFENDICVTLKESRSTKILGCIARTRQMVRHILFVRTFAACVLLLLKIAEEKLCTISVDGIAKLRRSEIQPFDS